MMESFHSRFPEVAEKETRCVIVPYGKKIPAGKYFLLESFCNDKECECRRLFINFLYNEKIVATIGYGWEDLEFYKEWMGDEELIDDVKGPILELGGIQTKYSQYLLELFKEVILKDEQYIERIKKHYKMFKKSL